MTQPSAPDHPRSLPGRVAQQLDPYRLVINRGSLDGIRLDDEFVVYGFNDKPVIDPETGKPLGALEIVRGRGKVIQVQESMAVIRSSDTSYKPIVSYGASGTATSRTQQVLEPFKAPVIGDYARRTKRAAP